MKFTNPVIPGFHPDPSVCRVGEEYYLVTSSFEYFPGVPIFHSRDLVHWRQIGHCLTRPSQLELGELPSSAGIFAPALRYHAGTFYMVTTLVGGKGHFYVHTQDPAGEWSEPVWVDVREDLGFSIDPSLFFDDDGAVYFSCTGPGQQIYQFEIDIATGELRSRPRLIWSGLGGKYPEGPHLYKINDQYYLLAAEGGTEYGHMVTIARAASPYGPFESCPHNPILTHRSTDLPIQATGHADLIQAHDGSWWLVCLGVRPVGYPPVYHLGRETFLAPVEWTADGWPVVGDNGRIALDMDADGLPVHTWPAAPQRDDFDGANLAMVWNTRRNLAPEYWSLSERPGWLRVTGSSVTLDDVGATTFVGRRQQHFECQVAAHLDFQPVAEGQEAGLTVLMNEKHHYDLAVRWQDDAREVIVRRRIGSLVSVVARKTVPPGPLTLRIDAGREWVTFSVDIQGEEPVVLASGETRYLSTEVAGGFTGVYFGMYAQGSGDQPCAPAYFDWFDYLPA